MVQSRPDLRHYVGMGDRYRTADGWAVEVVALSATPDGNDGERLKITYCGFFVALVRTVGELETWLPLSDLEPETLTRGVRWCMGLPCSGPQCRRRAEGCCRREKTDTCTVALIVALAEEGTLMPTDPETGLALAAGAQRLANWTGTAMPPSPAAVVTITRRLELAAHAEVERAARRVREEGQGWAVIASLLGLDA
jgi:hypothetical protein